MAARRGRPRKIELPKPIEKQIEKENIEAAKAPVLEQDHVPAYHREVPTASRGGMIRRSIVEDAQQSNEKRLAEALAIVNRIKLHGGSVQEHNNCVTITLGRCSECANITTPDHLLNQMVDRMISAGG